MSTAADGREALEARRQRQVLLEQERLCRAANVTASDPAGLHCPRVFDGIACWPSTPAGVNATQPCPHYFKGFYPHNTMQKYCTANGTWYFSPEHNTTWTNYSSCHLPPSSHGPILQEHLPMVSYSDNELIQVWTPVIKKISRTGYGISLTNLLIAMIIFCSIRKLRSCPRTNLHTHLFVSFILKSGMWFAMDSVSEDWLNPGYSGSWVCKTITGLWQYFTMANYSWITMEGLYLFCLIYLALFSDHSSITAYVLMGWGFPVCFVVPWVIVRALKEDFYCWRVNINQDFFWIIRGPTLFLILVNAVLFVCIVLVLMQKLNASISVETRRYRKLARSTLVLIPLFGFHYVIFVGMSAFMNVNRILELIWLFADQWFASFQGFFVAILYCFMSSEVKMELNKHWAAWRYSNLGDSAKSSHSRSIRGKSYRSVGRSSVQSTTLMDRPSDLSQGRNPCPFAKTTAEKNSPRQLCVVEAIKEASCEETRESAAAAAAAATGADGEPVDHAGDPTAGAAAAAGDAPPANGLMVRYDGDDGGSVRIQTAPHAAGDAPWPV